MRRLSVTLAIVALTFLGLLLPLEAAVLTAGTNLEIRLSAAAGSRISHQGDGIEGVVIAPVFGNGRIVIPPRSTVSGYVESVDRVGLGIRHSTAKLQCRFDSLQLPGGVVVPIEAQVVEVETAKERVTSDGAIGGMQPMASLSSGISFAISAVTKTTAFAAPAIGLKFLVARSPDPEIFLPSGTDLILELTKDTPVITAAIGGIVPSPLSSEESQKVKQLLESVPDQQASRSDERKADLLNILLLGSADQIDRAFYGAGWAGEQSHSVMALYRMFHCLVERMGYSTAPMAKLTLNGFAADRAYQKSLNTFAKRHHIRLWNQDHSGLWLGAATEDVSYTIRRMHLTHATAPEIDNERAKIVNDLWMTGCVDAASLVERRSLKPVDEKGHALHTDDSIAVLRINDCTTPRATSTVSARNRPRPRAIQVLAAVGNDVTRSNPVSLAYFMGKSLAGSSYFHHGVAQSPKFEPQLSWRRPSVIDVAAVSDSGKPTANP